MYSLFDQHREPAMSWKPELMPVLDVVLRVPPLFVMDSLLNGTFWLSWLGSYSNPDVAGPETDSDTSDLSSVIAIFLTSFICK